MTEHEKMVGTISVKLEAITQVLELLLQDVPTNPVGGVVTAIEAVVQSIHDIIAIKPGGNHEHA